MSEEQKRIACIHLNQIGDLLFSLPALYNLRTQFPDAYVTSVVRPSCESLLDRTGLVDDIVVRKGGLASVLSTGQALHNQKYDMVLLFSTSGSGRMLAQLSGAREIVGFTHSPASMLFSKRVDWSPPPSTQNNLRLVQAIGCAMAKTDYVGLVQPHTEDLASARELLCDVGIPSDNGFVVLSPGTSSGRGIKTWPDERYIDISEYLARKFGLSAVLVGLKGAGGVAADSAHIADLTGKTSLPVLAALLMQSRAFVGVDSGVMHLAAAVGTRCISLFGPTNPSITGPQGSGHVVVKSALSCMPCMRSKCEKGLQCMLDISSEMVSSALDRLLCSED